MPRAAVARGMSGENTTSAGSLMAAEDRFTGAVGGAIYAEYLRAAG